jgi:hypothetical protein
MVAPQESDAMSDYSPQHRAYMTTVLEEGEDYLIVEVPSMIPSGHRLVTARVNKKTGYVEEMILTVPTEHMRAFAEYQVQCGLLERSPTDNEMDTLMKRLGYDLVNSSIEAMTSFGSMLQQTLGVGDEDDIRQARIVSAMRLLHNKVKGWGVNPVDHADLLMETAEEMVTESDGEQDYADIAVRHDKIIGNLRDTLKPETVEDRSVSIFTIALTGQGCMLEAIHRAAAALELPEETTKALVQQGGSLVARYSGKETGHIVMALETMFSIAKPGFSFPVARIRFALEGADNEKPFSLE